MAYDAFMWLDGGNPAAKGETTDKTYKAKSAFEIQSFSFGASNPTTVGSATTGVGAGKVSISSFNIMKATDTASPALFQNCCAGTHFTGAHVVLRKAGGSPDPFLQYDFQEVFVESIQWSGSSGGDVVPSESVSFAFGEISLKYAPQNADGSLGTAIPASWSIVTNVQA